MRRLLAAVLSLALLACSCQEREANRRIEAADRAYQAGQYGEARAGYEEILQRWPNSTAAVRATEGMDRLERLPPAPPAPE